MYHAMTRFIILICNIKREFIRYFQKQPPEVFCKKDSPKDFANFTEKHLCWNLFLIKLQAWRPATLLKRNSNIARFLRAPVLKNIWERTKCFCKKKLSPREFGICSEGSTIDSMYRLFFSRAPQYSIDTIISTSFISSTVYSENCKQ